MKKFSLLFLLAALFVLTGFMKYDRGVRDDIYYSETRPNIQLKIDRSLRYLGKTSYRSGRAGYDAYMWLTPGDGPGIAKMFIIEHETISQERALLRSSQLFRGLPSFAKGTVMIWDDSYQYIYYITEPTGDNFWSKYIKSKGFVINQPMLTIALGKISTMTASTKFYYMKTYDPTKHFRGVISQADQLLMDQFIDELGRDIKYRGKYKK